MLLNKNDNHGNEILNRFVNAPFLLVNATIYSRCLLVYVQLHISRVQTEKTSEMSNY
jgi:hypothetical protein